MDRIYRIHRIFRILPKNIKPSKHFTIPGHERAFERDGSGGGAGVEVGDEGVGGGVGLADGVVQDEVDRVGVHRQVPFVRQRFVSNCLIYFHNVRDFRIEGLHLRHQRYWAACFVFCSFGEIRDIRFEADISWMSEDGKAHDPLRLPAKYRNVHVFENCHAAILCQADAELKNARISGIFCPAAARIGSVLDFVKVDGELHVSDVFVDEAEHLLRNSGNARVSFENVHIRKLTGERIVDADDGPHGWPR